MNNTHNAQDIVLGALVGGAISALTVMLFATPKGKQFRDTIANKYQEFQEKAKEVAENAKEHVESGAKKAASKVKGDD